MRTAKLHNDGRARSIRALHGAQSGLQGSAAPPDSSEPALSSNAQDVWWRLEDLFLRLASRIPVSVDEAAGVARIFLHGLAQVCDEATSELRRAAVDARTHAWEVNGVRRSFVKMIEPDGDDWICTLASLNQIERWPGGHQLSFEIRRFLVELGRRGFVDGRSW